MQVSTRTNANLRLDKTPKGSLYSMSYVGIEKRFWFLSKAEAEQKLKEMESK